jgi:hypothetical protein
MNWYRVDPRVREEHLGLIPSFLRERDERGAAAQIAERYIGGWSKFEGFKLGRAFEFDTNPREQIIPSLRYPGDSPTHPLAFTRLRDETIALYEHAWVVVFQPSGEFEVARLD